MDMLINFLEIDILEIQFVAEGMWQLTDTTEILPFLMPWKYQMKEPVYI